MEERRGREKKKKKDIPTVVDGLCGVLDLENTAIGGECGDGKIVTSAYAAHCFWFFALTESEFRLVICGAGNEKVELMKKTTELCTSLYSSISFFTRKSFAFAWVISRFCLG